MIPILDTGDQCSIWFSLQTLKAADTLNDTPTGTCDGAPQFAWDKRHLLTDPKSLWPRFSPGRVSLRRSPEWQAKNLQTLFRLSQPVGYLRTRFCKKHFLQYFFLSLQEWLGGRLELWSIKKDKGFWPGQLITDHTVTQAGLSFPGCWRCLDFQKGDQQKLQVWKS